MFWVELKEAAGSALLKVPLGSLSGRKADWDGLGKASTYLAAIEEEKQPLHRRYTIWIDVLTFTMDDAGWIDYLCLLWQHQLKR